jgi:hypothetical protein
VGLGTDELQEPLIARHDLTSPARTSTRSRTPSIRVGQDRFGLIIAERSLDPPVHVRGASGGQALRSTWGINAVVRPGHQLLVHDEVGHDHVERASLERNDATLMVSSTFPCLARCSQVRSGACTHEIGPLELGTAEVAQLELGAIWVGPLNISEAEPGPA